MDRFITKLPKPDIMDDIVQEWQKRPRIKDLCTMVYRSLTVTLPTGAAGKRSRPWLGWSAEKKRRVGERLVTLKNFTMLRNEMGV